MGTARTSQQFGNKSTDKDTNDTAHMNLALSCFEISASIPLSTDLKSLLYTNHNIRMGRPQIQGGAPFDKGSVCLSIISTPSNSLHEKCVAIQAIHCALAVPGVLYAGSR